MSTESTIEAAEAVVAKMSPEMVAMLAMMKEMSDANRQMFLDGIAELRKPDEATAKKQAEEAARSMQLTMSRIAAAKDEEAGKAERIAGCSHTKPNGKTNLRGQVHSNGYAKAHCSYCQYNSGWFAAAPYELTGGLNMDGWGSNAFAIVESRVRNSAPPPPIPKVPHGTTISF